MSNLAKLKSGQHQAGLKMYKDGGMVKHDDVAADKALVKKMVKPSAMKKGMKKGGKAGCCK